jgi:glycerol-3-phosphate dehydrogenase
VKRDPSLLTAREFDLLVVGGGIHGVAAAWDAAQRGLRVALVERDDFGCGVTANSLKTVHGGLRYLQSADLPRFRESVKERRALLRIAPALVRPLGFLVPTYGHGLKGREALAAGVLLNNLVSADRNRDLAPSHRIPPGRMLSAEGVRRTLPGIRAEGLSGAALWYDAQVDSAERLVMGFALAAASAGAVLANHVEAISFLRNGDRVTGVLGRDVLAGDTLEVRARLTLNAAGPEVFGLLDRERIPRPPGGVMDAMNLVFSRPMGQDVAVGALAAGRFLFLVPWGGRCIAGTAYTTTDTTFGAADIAAFLSEVQGAFPWAGLSRRDLSLVHRGRVPGEGGAFGLSRRALVIDHEAEHRVPGLLSILGVKLTTARGVAETAVDLAERRLGRPPAACRTAETPLPESRPLDGTLAERTTTAVRSEMALTLADAVLRRLDLGTGGPPAESDLAAVEAVMAAELGWSEARRRDDRAGLARHYPEPLQ